MRKPLLIALVACLSLSGVVTNWPTLAPAVAAGWVKIITPPSQNAELGVPKPQDGSPAPSPADTVTYPTGALLKTTRGDMVIELFPKEAPVTVRNFQALVAKQFYNGLVFHRVVPGFVVQTGDPTGTGSGGSDKTIKLEVSQKLSHTGKGIVAMARKQDANSASSQFYITLAPAPSLDGKYAVFGRVISGLDVLDDITQTDRVTELTLTPLEGVKRSPQAPPQDTFGYRLGKLIRPTKGKTSAKGGLVKP